MSKKLSPDILNIYIFMHISMLVNCVSLTTFTTAMLKPKVSIINVYDTTKAYNIEFIKTNHLPSENEHHKSAQGIGRGESVSATSPSRSRQIEFDSRSVRMVSDSCLRVLLHEALLNVLSCDLGAF